MSPGWRENKNIFETTTQVSPVRSVVSEWNTQGLLSLKELQTPETLKSQTKPAERAKMGAVLYAKKTDYRYP